MIKIDTVNKYFQVWKQLTNCAFSSYASNRIDTVSYFMGKLIRFGFFWVMIVSIFRYANNLAGYGKYEVLLFFITFNIVDVTSQAIFRGIYMFKNDVILGNFDLILIKPINTLFYTLTRLTDMLDLIFLIPLMGVFIYTMYHISVIISVGSVLVFLLFLVFSFIIITALHIISASISMWTSESQGIIWLYRHMMLLGTFPPEIFNPGIQTLLTYIFPIIVIIAFPTKALLGLFTFQSLGIAAFVASIFFAGSVLFWKQSLRRYSSASS